MFIKISEDVIVNTDKIISVVCTARGDKSGLDKEDDEITITTEDGEEMEELRKHGIACNCAECQETRVAH